jgi:hypothetical protein
MLASESGWWVSNFNWTAFSFFRLYAQIDTYFQDARPTEHVIIDPTCLGWMRQKGWYDRPGVRILEGRWQDFSHLTRNPLRFCSASSKRMRSLVNLMLCTSTHSKKLKGTVDMSLSSKMSQGCFVALVRVSLLLMGMRGGIFNIRCVRQFVFILLYQFY